MSSAEPVTIDFETRPIEARPNYPPRPVGVSIKWPGQPTVYYAWGHPANNNTTEDAARRALEAVWASELHVLCHNAKFDLDVAETHLHLPMLPWERIEETMFLLFLDNPHSMSLALKPAAERLLGMKPKERDAVGDWLIKQQDFLREQGLLPADVKLSCAQSAKKSPSGQPQYYAAWICLAPGDLVGKYANGDVDRTAKLFKKLMPSIKKRKMVEAYNRERKLIPILLEIERQGVRVDTARLEADVAVYGGYLTNVDRWLRRKLGVAVDFNLNADQPLIQALAQAGMVDLQKLGVTPKSDPANPTYKADQASLRGAVTDAQMVAVLQYRTQLNTCLNTFMRPWLATALESDGLLFTNWNQIRSEKAGARTGRFSSTPNFQNIPQEFKPIFKHDLPQEAVHASMSPEERKAMGERRAQRYKLPAAPFALPPLPQCRGYLVPYFPGHVLLDRDYSQQEPRIFGHFEGGPLREAYNADPWLDLHDHAHAIINNMLGTDYKRKAVKQINLGLLYGMGVKLLADKSEVTEEQARQLKQAVLEIFPGLRDMNNDMKVRFGTGLYEIAERKKRYKSEQVQPIRTWGGRVYECEEPKYIDNRLWTFEYKMVNLLIQGSAADCTKEALIHYWNTKEPEALLLLTVHDEILVSAPAAMSEQCMETLRASMEHVQFDVPMLSEGTLSTTDWGHMVVYDKHGKRL